MRWVLPSCVMVLMVAGLCAVAATTQPSARDSALHKRLAKLDRRLGKIQDLQADFVRLHKTAVLKKPMRSSGTVRIKAGRVRWDTASPARSVTVVTPTRIRVYQPAEHREEIYAIRRRYALLGASPLPNLADLGKRFDIRRMPAGPLRRKGADKAAAAHELALHLRPRDKAVARHVQAVELLFDEKAGHLIAMRLVQGPDDMTTYYFSNIRTNLKLPDAVFKLDVPADTHISRPLSEDSD